MQFTVVHRFLTSILFLFSISFFAQTTQVGNGSYTNTFPGTDIAGRNGFPSGAPQLSGNAIGKPVPTNDWWSKLVKENHADNLFNYPMTLKTTNNGLIVTYIPWGVIGDSAPIEVKLSGLATTQTTVSDYSDWTVTMNWKDASRELKATAGIGMPFLYFEKEADDVVEIKVNSGTATINNELLIIENAAAGADFVFYAPTGSTWTKNASIYTSSLSGKTYWSMAMLPQSNTNVSSVAQEYKQYAYVFPTNTTTSWNFNPSTSKVITDFSVTTSVKEGTETEILLGLLPHQWNNLSSASAIPNKYTYSSVRGAMKTMKGNAFQVEHTFKGILPTLPYLANYSVGFNPANLDSKIASIENDGLSDWTDSYNEGQVMNRLIQTARIADQMGNTTARNKMIATVKQRLENWLSHQSGEKAFLFYYNSTWSALLGYPSGHGQDTNLNDHHFHWGYFIHAAAFMEQFEPGWASQWGGMINLLVRDAASSDRNDTTFPFLRNFSPYAGHSWANGFATFPQGNDQESTSESMQFASSLIHWGSITNNTEIRDLGIYIYTTEQTAIEEYWFDMYDRNFRPEQTYSLVSRVWGNSYDNGTFWTSDIAASYGIELYPIHGGSLYLAHNPTYVTKLWNEITQNTGIIGNQANPNLWHDTYWQFLSFINPQAAIDLYDAYPDRSLKFGISDAQTYHWLHSMNALGTLNPSITADYPIAAVFVKDGNKTYVAHNYTNAPKTVTFSDGFQLEVPAREMATSKNVTVSGVISTSFTQAFANGSVDLTVTTSGSGVSKVEFFDGNTLIGSKLTAPFVFKAENLTLGVHGMYAKIYQNADFAVSNIVKIQVGEQLPFLDVAFQIPGIIESGNYDKFEGGLGQNIAYVDGSQINEGDYRTNEYVDAADSGSEGKTIGWLAAGEWLEYTIDVQTAGKYDLNLRYASGNSNGGGPFYFEIDGKKISADITVPTSGNWNTWATKTVNNIEFTQGKHILRLVISSGEFNLGKLTFSYASPLGYTTPVANAGENIVVILPASTAVLNASASSHPENKTLTYVWEQVYGPSVIAFDNLNSATPTISNLEKGIYKCKVTVNDGSYTSFDEMLVIVQETSNAIPVVNITSPTNNSSFSQGTAINITASASDLDGSIAKVEFYDGETKIGEDTTSPFSFSWNGASVGNHSLKAIVTDNEGATATSSIISISVQEVKKCVETSNVAQQGSFSTGYKATFETIGTSVKISFELLDTNRAGVIAYLWKQSPFGEVQMDLVSGLTFTKTIGGLADGETISYACKFAFAGGLAVTKYITYKVGTSCETLSISDEILENEITIFPNPAKSQLHIRATSVEIACVEIYSTLGTLVKKVSKNNAPINIEEISSGLYLVKIYTEKGIVIKRFLKN
ncbi:carbohydrate-binding protein [Polaribacter sp. BAL334]|uniref:glycosyl hydrolase n=1 Tax=Polaribacter sp. BAL334 TaxID=1708178 RepID=UPI0018D20590|nr:glycosyl hydrolase [Polaribacter sp. BAL334]MBG7610837.1 carbohydrate-binding protein [Polaribacter sp. BAL334]